MGKANPWLEFAMEDYKAIQNLKGKKLYRIVLFHAQQFFEKSIKGILVEKGIQPPRTHDLIFLWKKLKIDPSEYGLTESDLHYLTSIYIETRYPPDIGLLPDGEPSQEDEMETVALVEKFLQELKRKGQS